MRTFTVRFNPFDFFGKTRYEFAQVQATSCLQAIVKVLREKPTAEINAVKPGGSLRWRQDPGLVTRQAILKQIKNGSMDG